MGAGPDSSRHPDFRLLWTVEREGVSSGQPRGPFRDGSLYLLGEGKLAELRGREAFNEYGMAGRGARDKMTPS